MLAQSLCRSIWGRGLIGCAQVSRLTTINSSSSASKRLWTPLVFCPELRRYCTLPSSKKRERIEGKLPLTLGNLWTPDDDPTGWIVAEKLDGVRAYWDGEKLWSKQGRLFPASEEFTSLLPQGVRLDGELWLGRGKFQEATGIAMSKNPVLWRSLEYHIFDLPLEEGTYEERLEKAGKIVYRINDPRVKMIEVVICSGQEELDALLQRVDQDGGEGLMLRKPNTPYESGRSDSLLKLKKYHDMEVLYKGPHPARGYHALLCELPSGKTITVNCVMSDWKWMQDKQGCVITIKYSAVTKKGLPKWAFMDVIRSDLDWDDVKRDFFDDPPRGLESQP